MPTGAKTLLVILLIPFLFGFGHDVYLNYFSDDAKIRDVKALRIDPSKFLVSDMGWVWNKYSPNTMEAARDMMEPATWQSKLDPILQLPTMVVGLIPWAITFAYLFLSWLLGIWPCSGRILTFSSGKRKKDDFAVYKHAKSNSMKFKR